MVRTRSKVVEDTEPTPTTGAQSRGEARTATEEWIEIGHEE